MRRALVGLLMAAAMVVPTGVAAQSPSPEPSVTRNLCLTVSGPLVATVEELTQLVTEGVVTIDAFVGGECGQAEPNTRVLPPVDGPLPVEVVDSGFSLDDGDLRYAVVLRNPNMSGWVAQYMAVQIAVVDGQGGLVDSASDNITLLPGQTSAITGSVDGGRDARSLEIQVSNAESEWEEIDFTTGDLAFSQVKLKRARYDNEITGRVASDFSDQQETLKVIAVYRRGGKIIGGDYTFLDFVPAGGRATFKIFSDFLALPSGVKVEMYYSL